MGSSPLFLHGTGDFRLQFSSAAVILDALIIPLKLRLQESPLQRLSLRTIHPFPRLEVSLCTGEALYICIDL